MYCFEENAPFLQGGLRAFELILFGGLALQLGLMMASRLNHFAAKEDATSLVSTQNLYFTAFCLHILTYGIFMPNTWKRAAVVTTSLALLPYAIWYGVIAFNPNVQTLANQNKAMAPIPVTLIAALIGSFGSHIINRGASRSLSSQTALAIPPARTTWARRHGRSLPRRACFTQAILRN